jgi:alanyl-tRNA synthetase
MMAQDKLIMSQEQLKFNIELTKLQAKLKVTLAELKELDAKAELKGLNAKQVYSFTQAYNKLYEDLSKVDSDNIAQIKGRLRKQQRQSITNLLINEHNRRLILVSGVSAAAVTVQGMAQGFETILSSWSALLAMGFAGIVAIDNLLIQFRSRLEMFGNTEMKRGR